MKKLIYLLAVIVMSQQSFAQEKTEKKEIDNPSISENKMHHKMDNHHKKEMMKELNLTEEQKAKIKKMKDANKETKDAIQNNPNLTEEQKKLQLKDIHKKERKNFQEVLTDEQKKKMKALKSKKKNGKTNHHNKVKQEQDGGKDAKATSPSE